MPWYVEWVLGFPRAPYGSVSVQVWGASCAVVVALVGDTVGWALASILARQQVGGKRNTKTAMPVKATAAT